MQFDELIDEATTPPASNTQQTRKDYVSDQMVRWCPGCGDFAILAQVQKVMPALGIPRERYVFVSGIGCSSRFPYYMNTYGMHTIHGRAPTFATGLKCARPELSVWVVTGDGDGLSIGGNHLLHAIRRNIDIKILLFNNKIYGLTKGQASPTSELGKKTKSSPAGTIDRPIDPLRFALGAEGTFVARSIDTDVEHLSQTLERAGKHKGTAFIEIFQNCIVFNDNAWGEASERSKRDDVTLRLEHGKPMIFGKNKDKGIRLNGFKPEVVPFDPAKPPKDILIHDERAGSEVAFLLTEMKPPHFPTPVGVFRSVAEHTYDESMHEQMNAFIKPGADDLEKLLIGSESWTVA